MKEVWPLREVPPAEAGPATSVDYAEHGAEECFVIDNGSHALRAGWNTDGAPRMRVENIAARYRERKTNQWCMLAGQECYLDTQSRSQIKSPFEQDLICNFDVMENMLDYVFCRFGITDDSVAHPVYLTEPLTNPRQPRAAMSELLFEGYNAPAVAYSVDSLQAFGYTGLADGLVVSSGNHSTHVVPVLDGRARIEHARKFAWGASTASDYLLKLMQMKYPAFPGRLTHYQANTMYKEHAYHTLDYTDAIRTLASPSAIVDIDRVVQFPFVAQVWEEKTEEDVARAAERKREAARRLHEQLARQRLEKLVAQEDEYALYSQLREDRLEMRKADWELKVKESGFQSAQDLDQYLDKLNKTITRLRAKEAGIELPEEHKEEPTFPLVDVPDHQLNEVDLKEKRKQRLLKASYDARMRMKEEKERERARKEAERVEDERLRNEDLTAWTRKVRGEHEDIIERIRERKKHKEQLADRKSLAAQNRMKNIASLAADGKGKKRKRGGQDKDDEFGKNDEDWLIYREIDNANDSDDEEDDLAALKAVEDRLLEFDPNFTLDDTSERKAMRKHALLNAFVRGMAPDDPLDSFDPSNVEHTSQLHMNIERIRVPEVVWQPSIAGIDAAGITELISNVLRNYNPSERSRLVKNVFTTGGNTLVPYFDARLSSSLKSVLPVDADFQIVRSLDDTQAWKGMAKWASTPQGIQARITKAEYEEFGPDFLKPNPWGNR